MKQGSAHADPHGMGYQSWDPRWAGYRVEYVWNLEESGHGTNGSCADPWYTEEIQTLKKIGRGSCSKFGCGLWGFTRGKNTQFNLTNHRRATRWIVERRSVVEHWPAMRTNLTPVIVQIKVVGKMFWPLWFARFKLNLCEFSQINELLQG